jgi:anthranilate synthase component 1
MRATPDRAEFCRRAGSEPVVPVRTEVLADRHTPVSAFEAVAGEGPAFLLESVEGGERWARWSFAGWDPLFTLRSVDGVAIVDGADIPISPEGPLEALRSVLTACRTPRDPELPPLASGLVGYLGYDVVRHIEHLPGRPPDDRGLPEMAWQAVGSLLAFDRLAHTITVIRNVVPGDDPETAYDDAVARLEQAVALLGEATPRGVSAVPEFRAVPDAEASMTRDEYEAAVAAAVEHVGAGDVFQVVPSVRFAVPLADDAFSVYRALRLVNPSPFLFFVRDPDVVVAGASPELMSRLRGDRVESRPIAGTRPRGVGPEEDEVLEAELLADPKERAEHVMLVDLARNDLGRVCRFGSVKVDDLMVVERYSHVMHIVSGVSGTLRDGLDAVDVIAATFPHGTVSGAPKVRAMEIIDELEPVARGPYAGAVGYLGFSGDMDTAIALRSMVAAGGTAWVQAGAGVVADSVPAREYDECVAKAAAVLAAIAGARHV